MKKTHRAAIKAGMRDARRKGRRIGVVPYGWDLKAGGVHLVENWFEQAIMRWMSFCLNRHKWSYREIADHLNKCEVPAKGGGLWYHATVKKVLLNRRKRPVVWKVPPEIRGKLRRKLSGERAKARRAAQHAVDIHLAGFKIEEGWEGGVGVKVKKAKKDKRKPWERGQTRLTESIEMGKGMVPVRN